MALLVGQGAAFDVVDVVGNLLAKTASRDRVQLVLYALGHDMPGDGRPASRPEPEG